MTTPKSISNTRDGYHYNSAYWQKYKGNIPDLNSELQEIAIGMLLGDASISKISREAYIKFEQGYKQGIAAR